MERQKRCLLSKSKSNYSKLGFYVTLSFCLLFCPCISGFNGIINGANLKLACYSNPPYELLIKQPDGNYTAGGTTVSMYKWLSERLNFTFTLVPVINETLIAKFGVYETAIQKVVNKEVDGLFGSLINSPERSERMDYTSFVWTEPFTLIVPKPEEESRLFAFIRPFQPLVWLFIAITTSVMIGIMSWFSWIYINNFLVTIRKEEEATSENERNSSSKGQNTKLQHIVNSISFYTIYVLNVLTNHGTYTPNMQNSFRILAGCWLLGALVLVNSYSSIVVSSLTVPQMKPAINSFEDIAASKEVSLILREDLLVTQQILSSTSGVFKTLGDQARQNPGRLFMDFPSIFKKLEVGRYAFPFIRSFTRIFVVNQFKKEGKCRFQISDPLPVSSGYFVFFLQKNSKYANEMSYGLGRLWETGLTRLWVEQLTGNYRKADKCFVKHDKTKSSTRQVPIKLQDLYSAFLILGIGIGLALVVFLVELATGSRRSQKEINIE